MGDQYFPVQGHFCKTQLESLQPQRQLNGSVLDYFAHILDRTTDHHVIVGPQMSCYFIQYPKDFARKHGELLERIKDTNKLSFIYCFKHHYFVFSADRINASLQYFDSLNSKYLLTTYTSLALQLDNFFVLAWGMKLKTQFYTSFAQPFFSQNCGPFALHHLLKLSYSQERYDPSTNPAGPIFYDFFRNLLNIYVKTRYLRKLKGEQEHFPFSAFSLKTMSKFCSL